MPRYIDADKANKNFEEVFCKSCNSYHGVKCRACDMRDGADIFFDEAPTEDVQPVKHGKWILTGDEQLDNIYFGNKCSECGFIYCGNFFNYCPECGAKMDKED